MIFLCHLLLQGLVHLSWFVYCDSRKGRRNRHGGSIKISAVTVTKKCEQRRHCYTLRDLTFWVSLCVIVYHSRGYSTGLPSSIIDASELVVPHWQAVYDRFTNTHGRVASSEMSDDDLGTTIKKRIQTLARGMDKRRYDIHMWSGSDIIAYLIALVWVTRPHYYNTLLYSHWHRDSTHLEMAHYSVVFHGSTVNSVQSDFHIHNKDGVHYFLILLTAIRT